MDEPKKVYPNFKTHIILPFIFILTTVVAICFVAINDFVVEQSKIVIWFYFGVVLAYCALAIFDIVTNKDKSKKIKIFTIVMLSLVLLSCILYVVLFIVGSR